MTYALLFGNIALIVAFLGLALLGQRFGRRPLLILGGLWTLSLGVVIFYFLVANVLAKGSLVLSLALGV